MLWLDMSLEVLDFSNVVLFQYLELRFSKGVRVYASLVYILQMVN